MRFGGCLIGLGDLFVGRLGGQSGCCAGSKFLILSCSDSVQTSFISVKPQYPYKNPEKSS